MCLVLPRDVAVARKERAVMTGLVYKEWKQNRWFILSMILCGFAPVIALLFMHSEIPVMGKSPIRIGGLIAGFLAAGSLQMMVLRGDDRKLWAYWVTASADGYKGFLRVKYELILAMIVLFQLSLKCVDMGYCAAASDIGKADAGQISSISAQLCFVQILFRAIDIPFVYRFGSKKGSIIKMICIVTCTGILSAFLILNTENCDRLIRMCRKVINVQKSPLALSVCLVTCLALYFLSYRITCRLYLKGAEQYDH